jgi:hypothetical protein
MFYAGCLPLGGIGCTTQEDCCSGHCKTATRTCNGQGRRAQVDSARRSHCLLWLRLLAASGCGALHLCVNSQLQCSLRRQCLRRVQPVCSSKRLCAACMVPLLCLVLQLPAQICDACFLNGQCKAGVCNNSICKDAGKKPETALQAASAAIAALPAGNSGSCCTASLM